MILKIKKYIFLFLISCFVLLNTGISFAGTDSSTREFRGVWIATVENISWPSEKGLPVETQKEELLKLLDTATALHLNAVVLQVRPEGDAIYDSKLEPWSRYLSGTEGQAPEPYYDPLAFAVEECHKRCLELHAWFNPYRASLSTKTQHALLHISNSHPELVHTFGKLLWMEPGDPEVRKHTVDVIMDVVKRYDIDGVHFDDYFYPYDIAPKNPFPDDAVYGKYTAGGGTLNLDDWRRDNINQMVKEVYEGIKKEKPWVKFGIAPFGIWQPGNPPGIVGLNSYNELYSDSRKWLQEGWVDYLSPQLYWKIAPPQQSYPNLLSWWVKQNSDGRNIYPGNNIEKVGNKSKSWSASEIIEQINLTRKLGAQGNILWSIKPLMRNSGGLSDALSKESYRSPAIVPEMPWLDNTTTGAPQNVSLQVVNQTKIQLKWNPADDNKIWRWAVYKKTESGNWQLLTVLPVSQTSYEETYVPNAKDKSSYAVTALTRLANESSKAEVSL